MMDLRYSRKGWKNAMPWAKSDRDIKLFSCIIDGKKSSNTKCVVWTMADKLAKLPLTSLGLLLNKTNPSNTTKQSQRLDKINHPH